jgi:hypothetical protein
VFDNKNGPNFRPPRSNPRRNNGDNHHQDGHSSNDGNNQGGNGNFNPDPSSDPSPYDDDYNAEPVICQDQSPELVPMTCLEAKQESSKFYFSKVLLDSGEAERVLRIPAFLLPARSTARNNLMLPLPLLA